MSELRVTNVTGPDGNPTAKFNGVERPEVPPGAVLFFAATTPPPGFLKANGAAISRSAYAKLFAAIGTQFGAGDGSTTFTLPDMRGEFPRGWDDGRGVDSGRVFGSAQAATRVFNGTQDAGGWGGRQIDANLGAGADFDSSETVSAGVSTGSLAVNGPAITNPTQNRIRVRPRNIALLACIKF